MVQRSEIAARVNVAGERVAEWAPIERVLAVLCALSPLVMVFIDTGSLRPSISDYYAMGQNQWFYVPLAIAAMLFVVNGVTKHGHRYNVVLGVALLGVIMFNLIDFQALHNIFAVLFFAGNVVVMWWFSDLGDNTRTFRKWFIVPLVAVGLAFVFVDGFTLWWAEQLSLVVIAAHFWLDSLDNVEWYNAVEPTVYPWSGSASAS